MNLFAYGTLMDPDIMTQVSASTYLSQKAILPQYIRKTVQGEVYPAIIHQLKSSVDGIIYFDVSPESWTRLDRFEGSLYQKVEVSIVCTNGEPLTAHSYVITQKNIHLMSDIDWSFENFLTKDKQLFQDKYTGYNKI